MNTLSNISLPDAIKIIIKRIMERGGECYIVGGAIRDILLNRKVKDWDIAVSFHPDQIEDVFCDTLTIPTGKKFGTITVVLNGLSIELTTFRGEGKYGDLRHPDKVIFVNDIAGDLSRRDFTINALAFNPYTSDTLLDPMNGIEDLEKKQIRTVGDANSRFSEDPLRMMRALRFISELEFTLEDNTYNAIKSNYKLIDSISRERVQVELNKTLLGHNVFNALLFMYKTNILNMIIPDLAVCFTCEQKNRSHSFNVGYHTLCVLNNTTNDLILRLAAFFHDIGKPCCKTVDSKGIDHFYDHSIIGAELTNKVLKKYRYSNKIIKRVANLVRYHDINFDLEKEKKAYLVRRILGKLGIDDTLRLFKLRIADIKAQNPDRIQDTLSAFNEIIEIAYQIIENKDPINPNDMSINGIDVINIGIGKENKKDVGKALNTAYELILNDPKLNKKKILLSMLKSKFLDKDKY